MSYSKLNKRQSSGELLESFVATKYNGIIRLIKLDKPYADGISFSVYEDTNNPFCSNGLYKDYNSAKTKFDLMVRNCSH